MLLLDGIVSIVAAACAVAWPAAMALTFVWVIGAWAIFSGALQIAAAISLRKVLPNEWALGLAGACSVAFGALAIYQPLAGGLALVWWLGAYAIAFGVLMIVLGLRLRRFAQPPSRGAFGPRACRSPVETAAGRASAHQEQRRARGAGPQPVNQAAWTLAAGGP
jgi:hypothetical protein